MEGIFFPLRRKNTTLKKQVLARMSIGIQPGWRVIKQHSNLFFQAISGFETPKKGWRVFGEFLTFSKKRKKF